MNGSPLANGISYLRVNPILFQKNNIVLKNMNNKMSLSGNYLTIQWKDFVVNAIRPRQLQDARISSLIDIGFLLTLKASHSLRFIGGFLVGRTALDLCPSLHHWSKNIRSDYIFLILLDHRHYTFLFVENTWPLSLCIAVRNTYWRTLNRFKVLSPGKTNPWKTKSSWYQFS